ncbi:MAG TPA: hypothetical protein VJT73_00620, partial [Polyangiaceae bacterium]|nr:hypothetical protein [Polyangiaceae bacterium]
MVRRELLAGLLLLGTSCGPAAATPPSDAGVSGDDAQIVSCKADPRVDTYVARLEKSGATNA